ncbi:MAG: PAS domain S-box protein, partial [Actinobacteria bacterium]|nr:PAS domain S-box protein [Actinomycetota bacterium]
MRRSRMHTIITPLVVAYAVAVLLVPLEMIQVLGVPVVVAGAYVAGMRGGVTAGLWAVIVSGAAFLLSGAGHVGPYVATAVGYIVIGLLVGLAVDDFTGQRKRLQKAVEAARLASRQLEMSQRRYRLLFEQGADPVYLHGLDHDAEPTSFIAVNDATCGLLGYTREELLGLTPRAIDAAPQPGQLRRMMRVLLREGTVR